MGSRLRLVAIQERAYEAWTLVTGRVASVERHITRFDSDSALSRLNQSAGSGEWVSVPRTLLRAVVQAHRGYRLSGGRFDPRIIGALEALGERAGVPLPRSPQTLDPGGRWLELDRSGQRARLASPIDLGGIGKGFALGEAAKALEGRGIGTFLLESGGDVVVSGRPPGDEAWRVAVEHPDLDLPAAVIRLTRGALATSSLRVRQWPGPTGSIVHHLLDPTTGQPATGIRSVTVHAVQPVWAEIWSTAAFVSGSGVAATLGTRAGLWIDQGGTLGMTPAAEPMVAWR
jgi:thiamine biosynthesis lipoprotein